MSTAKGDVEAPLEKLCTLEDIQYHLYVLETVRNGIAAALQDDGLPVPEEHFDTMLVAV